MRLNCRITVDCAPPQTGRDLWGIAVAVLALTAASTARNRQAVSQRSMCRDSLQRAIYRVAIDDEISSHVSTLLAPLDRSAGRAIAQPVRVAPHRRGGRRRRRMSVQAAIENKVYDLMSDRRPCSRRLRLIPATPRTPLGRLGARCLLLEGAGTGSSRRRSVERPVR